MFHFEEFLSLEVFLENREKEGIAGGGTAKNQQAVIFRGNW
jgi:hypothetical protein